MSKRARLRKKEYEPQLDNPRCPTCGQRDKLYETRDSGMFECDRCGIRFFFEEIEQDAAFAAAYEAECACKGKGCVICKPGRGGKKGGAKASAAVFVAATNDVPHSALVPTPGPMVELTDAL